MLPKINFDIQIISGIVRRVDDSLRKWPGSMIVSIHIVERIVCGFRDVLEANIAIDICPTGYTINVITQSVFKRIITVYVWSECPYEGIIR